MKITKEVIATRMSILNEDTGELFPVDGRTEVTNKYYSIKKLKWITQTNKIMVPFRTNITKGFNK